MLAGLHEVRVRKAEKKYNLKQLAKKTEIPSGYKTDSKKDFS